MKPNTPPPSIFEIDSRLTLIPVVNASAPFATALRRELLKRPFDALAVALPKSFANPVIEAVEQLPNLSFVALSLSDQNTTYRDSVADPETEDSLPLATYVPIDPCQAVIAAIRFALGEHIPIAWVGSDSPPLRRNAPYFPDTYALRSTSLDRFCAALLPSISPPSSPPEQLQIDELAYRINTTTELASHTIALCPLEDWPWVRQSILAQRAAPTLPPSTTISENENQPTNYAIDPRGYLFMLGELPFLTGLYERAREECDEDESILTEGLKELFMNSRSSYRQELGNRARQISPLLLSQCLKYIRNQSLLERRMTPSFYTIVQSAQQMMGDPFAVHLVNTATQYPYESPLPWPTARLGIDQADLPGDGLHRLVSLLPGPKLEWSSLELQRPPKPLDQERWGSRWNPYMQCSWPEEDTQIESFRSRIVERARQLLGADLARTEKFTTSIMDGIDLRETLRHWYDGSLYVKVNPPSIGHLDATVMVFDSEPDPRHYDWRATWFSEHPEESTLAFFATHFKNQMIGPGIAMATYGGSMFLYPPRPIPDIWQDPRLDFAETLEQRLIAAACLHSQSRHIALMSPTPPGLVFKKIAKRFGRKLVHVPLAHFSDSVIQQLRIFHVLNGRKVRSYAANFIRKA
ncbi:MAG: hypothetical protein RL240_3985 [Planctomycetota bacterium]